MPPHALDTGPCMPERMAYAVTGTWLRQLPMVDFAQRVIEGIRDLLVWYDRDSLVEILLTHRLGTGILVFVPIHLFIPVAAVASPVMWIVSVIRDRWRGR